VGFEGLPWEIFDEFNLLKSNFKIEFEGNFSSVSQHLRSTEHRTFLIPKNSKIE